MNMHMTQVAYDSLRFRDDIPNNAHNPFHDGDVYRLRDFDGVVKASVDRQSRRLIGWTAYNVTIVDGAGRPVVSNILSNRSVFLKPVAKDKYPVSNVHAHEVDGARGAPDQGFSAAVEPLKAELSDAPAEPDHAASIRDALTQMLAFKNDLHTHRAAWRRALEKQAQHEEDMTEADNTSPLYWAHELAVFDRVFKLLCDTLTASKPDTNFAPMIGASVQHIGEARDSLFTHRTRGGRYRILGQFHITPVLVPKRGKTYDILTTIEDMEAVSLSIGFNNAVVAYAGAVTNTTPVYGYYGVLSATSWRVQCTGRWTDTALMVAYQEVDKGDLWLRSAAEFWDGRFTKLEGAA